MVGVGRIARVRGEKLKVGKWKGRKGSDGSRRHRLAACGGCFFYKAGIGIKCRWLV